MHDTLFVDVEAGGNVVESIDDGSLGLPEIFIEDVFSFRTNLEFHGLNVHVVVHFTGSLSSNLGFRLLDVLLTEQEVNLFE